EHRRLLGAGQGAVAGHHDLRSASQPRRMAATSSGWRSISSASSSFTSGPLGRAARWPSYRGPPPSPRDSPGSPESSDAATPGPRLVSRPAAAVTRLLIWSEGTLTLSSTRTATDRRDTFPGAAFTCSVTLPTAKLRSAEFLE